MCIFVYNYLYLTTAIIEAIPIVGRSFSVAYIVASTHHSAVALCTVIVGGGGDKGLGV